MFVTLAFWFNWQDIAATVVVSPAVLTVLGACAAVLFALALWGALRDKKWASLLAGGMALFDIVGEFVAQGTLAIQLNVSFLVAALLLVLALFQLAAPGSPLGSFCLAAIPYDSRSSPIACSTSPSSRI